MGKLDNKQNLTFTDKGGKKLTPKSGNLERDWVRADLQKKVDKTRPPKGANVKKPTSRKN